MPGPSVILERRAAFFFLALCGRGCWPLLGAAGRGGAVRCIKEEIGCVSDMTPFTQPFYSSPAWKNCRAAYIKSVGGLCERCRKAGKIVPGAEVHHKVRLTPETVKDPRVALAWSNLELLCAECHRAEHRKAARRWKCGPDGRVEIPPGP